MYAVYLFEIKSEEHKSREPLFFALGIKHVDEARLKREYGYLDKEHEPKPIEILFYLYDYAETPKRRVRNLLKTYPEGTTNLVDKVRLIEKETGFPFFIMH
ncbi:MAG: hypothetical protein PHF86_11595 [Candidatus Nanoarchaeia archaeon]|nr:hypothetical protein [Candidatus Nanoarchaeia archaeon]